MAEEAFRKEETEKIITRYYDELLEQQSFKKGDKISFERSSEALENALRNLGYSRSSSIFGHPHSYRYYILVKRKGGKVETKRLDSSDTIHRVGYEAEKPYICMYNDNVSQISHDEDVIAFWVREREYESESTKRYDTFIEWDHELFFNLQQAKLRE